MRQHADEVLGTQFLHTDAVRFLKRDKYRILVQLCRIRNALALRNWVEPKIFRNSQCRPRRISLLQRESALIFELVERFQFLFLLPVLIAVLCVVT